MFVVVQKCIMVQIQHQTAAVMKEAALQAMILLINDELYTSWETH